MINTMAFRFGDISNIIETQYIFFFELESFDEICEQRRTGALWVSQQ